MNTPKTPQQDTAAPGSVQPAGSADFHAILRSYAEGCWARFVKSPGDRCNPTWAIQNRDEWIANCMLDVEKAIAAGRETLERLEALYRQNDQAERLPAKKL